MTRGAMDLRGRVVIVDAGATRTLRGIQGALAGIGAQSGVASRGITTTMTGVRDSARTMRAMRTVGGGHGAYAGLGATGGALGFLRNEYEYQKAMNRTQAVLNITDEKAFRPHRDLGVDLTKRYPATSAEIAKGASELAMAGLTMQQVNEVLEATVQGSLATGESIKTIGMGVTDVALGLGLQLTAENFEYLNNVMAAASTAYSQDYMGFLSGFYKAAPIARMIGMDVRQLSGHLGILADAGFKAEKGGTALRTSIINAAAPVPKAMAQLDKYGINLAKFKQRTDAFQLGGEEGAQSLAIMLANALGVGGVGPDDIVDSDALGLASAVLPILNDKDAFGNPADLKRRLVGALTGALGLTDPENTKLIAESVNSFVESGFQQLDFEGLMRELATKGFDKDLVAMDAVFKKRFAAPMGALMNSLRDGTFDSKMDLFLPRIENAVQRFAGILMKGLPGAVQRMFGAFDALLREMGKEGGAIDTITWGIDKLRQGFTWLSEVNPNILTGLTLALVGLGVLAPIGFALSGLAAGFTVLLALTGGILRFSRALWAMRRALSGIKGLLGLGAAATAAGAGTMGLLGAGAGGAAAGLTAKQASQALGRMGNATISGRMVAGMSAAGAAGAAATGVGAASRFGLLARALPWVGLPLMGLGAASGGYGAYAKGGGWWDILKASALGSIGLGSSDAQAADTTSSGGSVDHRGGSIDLPAIDVETDASGLDLGAAGQQAIADAHSIAAQIREALTLDLYSVGQQAMATLAAGITAGGAQAVAAANSVASQVRAAGQRVQLNTGPNMMPAR